MSGIARYLTMPGVAMEGIDDLEEAAEYARSRGWSDGLPIVPPTADRVERMLAYCDRPWDEPVARIPPRNGEATPLRIAANAVMAGCRPEYFPLVLLAVEAMCDSAFNLYGIQTTTHPVAPLVIVNGPIATELEINAGPNAFGPGWRSNATLGRAIRLALLNVGGAIPTIGDMATMGQPGKYSFVVAENEAASPWEPLHVERGFSRQTSTVTVVGAEGPHNINDHESDTGEGILRMVAGTVAITGHNNVYYRSEPLIALGPEHAKTIAGDGYSKADVKRYVFEQATVPLGKFSHRNYERRLLKNFPGRYDDAPPDTPVPPCQSAQDVMVIVLGGAGKHSMYLPTFGETRSVTRALKLADGREARSVEEFRSANRAR
jgi:hypothetical protein